MLTALFNLLVGEPFFLDEEEGGATDSKGKKQKGRDLTKYASRMERAAQLMKAGEYSKALDQILKILESDAAVLDSRREKCCDMILKVMDHVAFMDDWALLEELKRKLSNNGLTYTPVKPPQAKPRYRLMAPPGPMAPRWRERF